MNKKILKHQEPAVVRTILTSAGLTLCWVLSPDALVILGNSIGRSGMMFFVALTIGALLSLLTITLIHDPALSTNSDTSFTCIATTTGLLPAMTLTLASRLSLVLFLPTGMLVTAGFTFNETFVYWFPNFALSFLLLAIVLTLHLAGERIALLAQPFFISLTMSCLVLLCLAGLFGSAEPQSAEIQTSKTFSLSLPLVFTALVLFLGFDQPDASLSSGSRGRYMAALMAGFILLTLWGFVSLKYVPPARLAGSTIPYSISAREIFGQAGRVIMGIAVISGTFGLVNGLFLLAARSLRHMANHISPLSPSRAAYSWRVSCVIFSLCIAGSMAAGLAGSERLEIFIYGALLLWLLMVGVHCFAAASKLHKQQKTSARYWYLLVVVFPLAALWLMFSSEHAATLVVFSFLALGVSAACSAGWLWYAGKRPNKTIHHSPGDIS